MKVKEIATVGLPVIADIIADVCISIIGFFSRLDGSLISSKADLGE